ncbi:MAG: cobalt ECF transporter T component CbiQ [Elainellaceae cyanobacterium]
MRFELDEFAHLDSPLHRWDPRFKLFGFVILMFAFAFVEDLRILPAMLGITASLYLVSKLPLRYWLARFRYPGFFLLGIIVMLPLFSGETVIFKWGIVSVYKEGCLDVVLIASRFVSILTTVLILLGTTPFLKMVKAMRSLGLPPLLADLMLLTYRYLFDVAKNLTTMQQAMRLRGFGSLSHRATHQPWRRFPSLRDLSQLASLAGTLFVRSYEQSEHVYKAMKLRGYGSQFAQYRELSWHPSQVQRWWDAIALAVILCLAGGVIIAELL